LLSPKRKKKEKKPSEERALLSSCREAFHIEKDYINARWKRRSQGGKAGIFKGHMFW